MVFFSCFVNSYSANSISLHKSLKSFLLCLADWTNFGRLVSGAQVAADAASPDKI